MSPQSVCRGYCNINYGRVAVDQPEDAEQLINLRIAVEDGTFVGHLGEDAADRPDIDRHTVALRAEENFGSAVPQSDNLVSVNTDGHT